jgi:hypothetical protein
MKAVTCCHIDNFISSDFDGQSNELNCLNSQNSQETSSSTKIDKLLSIICDLNQILSGRKLSNYSNSDIINIEELSKCRDCLNDDDEDDDLEMTKSNNRISSIRLHLCATCFYIGCFNPFRVHDSLCHMRQHSAKYGHYLSVDIVYGYVYCFICQDFKYNEKFENCLKSCYDKIKMFPFGKRFFSYKCILIDYVYNN